MPVQTQVNGPASNTKSSGNIFKSKPSPKPRPSSLRIHFHPHPLKSINKTHIKSFNHSVMLSANPIDTGLQLRSSRSLFFHTTKASIAAYAPTNGRRSTYSTWGIESGPFHELMDLYMKHGVATAVVWGRDAEGVKVECSIALVGPGENVPKGLWKIRIWKEPVTWIRAKVMDARIAWFDACEQAKERKERQREIKKCAEEKEKALESDSESEEGDWDEKVL